MKALRARVLKLTELDYFEPSGSANYRKCVLALLVEIADSLHRIEGLRPKGAKTE